MTEESQRGNAWLSLGVALLGVILCGLPFFLKVSVENGALAFIILGVILSIIGMSVAEMYLNRAKVLATMFAPGGLLVKWPSPPDSDCSGDVVISLNGMIYDGELYPFEGYSCCLEKVELDEPLTPRALTIIVSMPNRATRGKHSFKITVPDGQQEKARQVFESLNAKLSKKA